LGIDRFVFHQGLRHGVQFFDIVLKQLLGASIVRVDDSTHFFVDGMRGLVRQGLVLSHRMPQKHLATLFAVRQRSHLAGQTPLSHHVARDFRSAFDVVGSTRGYALGTEDELFGNAATE
jgi:hypothetical protein